MFNTFAITRPHRSVLNWTVDILSVSGPYSDGEWLLEVENDHRDTVSVAVTREDLEKLRDWINSELNK